MTGTATFGEWLRKRRKALDLTQEQLADRVSCSPETIRKIERGARRPSREMVEAIAQRLAVPPEERSNLVEFARVGMHSSVVGTTGLTGSTGLTSVAYKQDNEPRPNLPPTNLPKPLTSFVGRHNEVETLRTLLSRAGVRLLTLTGAGGSGKTRLALQMVVEVSQDYQDGAHFVDLAPIADRDLVAPTIAGTLGVRETAGQSLTDTLKSYLGTKQVLLLLDNFEQILDAAPLVAELLSAVPNLRIVVTSREPLHLYGEHNFAVPPLQLPDRTKAHSLEELYRYEAVELFVQRAGLLKHDFTLTEENASAVSEICQRLDGLPLAIELAAARTNVLPPQAILSRFGDALKLLTTGPRDLPARQRTLHNTIEWSYNLLSEDEAALFRKLAVFAGGCSFDAIQPICYSGDDPKVDVLDLVSSLLDKSLLKQVEGTGGEPRFLMLETIHNYSRQKLAESEEEESLKREHALYFMALAEAAERHLTHKEQAVWFERLEEEHYNIRSAVRWSTECGYKGDALAAEVGLRIGSVMWRFWEARGYFSEGVESLKALLVSSITGGCPEQSRFGVLYGLGVLAYSDLDLATARSSAEQGLHLGRKMKDERKVALSLNLLGRVAHSEGDHAAARALHEQSRDIAKRVEDKEIIAASLHNIGHLSFHHGDYISARSFYEESLALRRELENKRDMAASLSSLGTVASEQGEYVRARALFEEAFALWKEPGDKEGIAHALTCLGVVAFLQGDCSTARSRYEESLALNRELGLKVEIGLSYSNLTNVALFQKDYVAAHALYREALAVGRETASRYRTAFSILGMGGAATGEGSPLHGAKLLAAGQAALRAFGSVMDADEQMVYEQSVQQARASLGEEEFEKAWQEGQGMNMEQAIEYALEEYVDSQQ